MRALIHIGTEKTGSTSIQEFLAGNRDRLDRSGIHFLSSAGERNNRWLPAACVDPDRPDDFFAARGIASVAARERAIAKFVRRFYRELDSLTPSVETVVMSSEHLQSRLVSQTEVDRFGRLLQKHFDDVQIICYLRPQADLCSSLYSTALRVGHDLDFATFLEQCSPDNPYYDYESLLGRWSNTFGHNSLTVRRFQDDLRHGDLIDDFSSWLSTDPSASYSRQAFSANASITPDGQRLALAINRAFPTSRSKADAVIRARAVDIVANRLVGSGQRPEPASWQEIQDMFAETNEAVRARYFPDEGALFPSQRTQSTRASNEEIDRYTTVVATTAEVLDLVAASAVERHSHIRRIWHASVKKAQQSVIAVPSHLTPHRDRTLP